MNSENRMFLGKELQNDNVYVESKAVDLQVLTGKPCKDGCSTAIISEGEIVHVASKAYAHVPNEKFFYEVEANLIENDLHYVTRSINRENKRFAVDYILSDENYHVDVKAGKDRIVPMLRFTNNYDGSGPTAGYFGFWRQVCSNGLHVAQTKVGFKVRHHKAFEGLILPNIKSVVQQFMDNEFFTLQKKFQVLAETPIKDISDFVRVTAEELELFVFQSSEKNPEPSKNARRIIETIEQEANLLGTDPNLWLGYNAINQYIHSNAQPFVKQKNTDAHVFSAVLAMAN